MQIRQFHKRYSLLVGVTLMFLYTWIIDLSNPGVLPFQLPLVAYLTLGWGFIFVSLLMTNLTLGREAMLTLLKRFLLWRVNWKWYLVAVLLPSVLQFASVFLTALLTGMRPDFTSSLVYEVAPLSVSPLILIVPWFLFEMFTNGEEMGWRGYILPRLPARYTALASSLIIGVSWSVWHLPKFTGTGSSGGRSLAWLTVFCMASAILYTWLYNNSRRSLLLVTLFHATNNTAGMFLPVSFSAAGGILPNLMIVLYILATVAVAIAAGPERLSRTEQK